MQTPYSKLPSSAFWKPSIAMRSPFEITHLWKPKFHIKSKDAVVTFGSCFAQNIGRALHARGYNWHITEKKPQSLPIELANKYGYRLFSCRTGNIYTTSLLDQWIDWALEYKDVPDEIWQKNGRFYDPFRPQIEPNGFASEDEVRLSREQTLICFKRAIKSARYFVFTLGLTESWFNVPGSGQGWPRYEYPMCPGTVAGSYDPARHKFINQPFNAVLKRLKNAIGKMNELNPSLKFILTVSPVPLTATASGNHVLTATMESKSTLRAVVGQLARNNNHIDYFPSYEIISAPPFQGMFYEPNKRSVTKHGVQHVMRQFFACQKNQFGNDNPSIPDQPPMPAADIEEENTVVCEEELLAAFGPST